MVAGFNRTMETDMSYDRISIAYPALLPGFFSLAEGSLGGACPRSFVAWRDPSGPAMPSRRRGERAYRAVLDAYRNECVAAISVLLQFADAVAIDDRVVVTAALSEDQFDRLAALGAELAEYENDDPAEDCDPLELEDWV